METTPAPARPETPPATADAASPPRPSRLESPGLERPGSWLTPVRAGLLLSLCLVGFQVASINRYGLTTDSPALFYAGDRTLYWLRHPTVPGALDLLGQEPADFQARFERTPDFKDPVHYPVLPGLVAALASAAFHDGLGWVDPIAGHHLGLVLLNGFALFLFCLYACALLGRRAGLAATVVLALFPSAFGHAPNNAKDWPCAQFYGLAVLAAGLGLVRNRARHLLEAGVLLGLGLSAKMNAVFVLPTLLLWLPVAWRDLYRGRPAMRAPVAAALLAIPYLAFAAFFGLWPWLWQGRIPDWWSHLNEYVSFMVNYGAGVRPGWTDYPLRALLFMTPPLVLAAAAVQLVLGARRAGEERAVWSLLVIWAGLPLLRIAAPHSNFYDANRHFIEYVPALAALAGAGAVRAFDGVAALLAARPARRLPPFARRLAPAGVATLALGSLLAPIAAYHPYETTYFNLFIGGLGRAQQKGLFAMAPPHDRRANGTEGDYWQSSLRDAGEDLRAIVPGPTTPVGVCGGPFLARANFRERPVARLVDWWEPEYHDGPYLLVSPREGACWWREIREFESVRPVLRRVERGGGLIYEILGPKDGQAHVPVSKPSWYEEHVHPTDKIGQRLLRAKRVAAGRPVRERIEPGGLIYYDVLDPTSGEVVWKQPPSDPRPGTGE